MWSKDPSLICDVCLSTHCRSSAWVADANAMSTFFMGFAPPTWMRNVFPFPGSARHIIIECISAHSRGARGRKGRELFANGARLKPGRRYGERRVHTQRVVVVLHVAQ